MRYLQIVFFIVFVALSYDAAAMLSRPILEEDAPSNYRAHAKKLSKFIKENFTMNEKGFFKPKDPLERTHQSQRNLQVSHYCNEPSYDELKLEFDKSLLECARLKDQLNFINYCKEAAYDNEFTLMRAEDLLQQYRQNELGLQLCARVVMSEFCEFEECNETNFSNRPFLNYACSLYYEALKSIIK